MLTSQPVYTRFVHRTKISDLAVRSCRVQKETENGDGDCWDMWAPYFMIARSALLEQSSRQCVFSLLQNVRGEREVAPFLGLCFLFFEGAVSFVSQAGLSRLCLQIISSCLFPFAKERLSSAVAHRHQEAEN